MTIYRYHDDKGPATMINIINHYKQRGNLYHQHDSIDEYYKQANQILRKQKLEKLNNL